MKFRWLLLVLLSGFDRAATAGEVEELLSRTRAGQAELRNWELEIPAVQSEREFTIRGKTEKSTFTTFHHDRSTLVTVGTRRFCLTPTETFGVEKTPASDQYALLFQSASKSEESFRAAVGKNTCCSTRLPLPFNRVLFLTYSTARGSRRSRLPATGPTR